MAETQLKPRDVSNVRAGYYDDDRVYSVTYDRTRKPPWLFLGGGHELQAASFADLNAALRPHAKSLRFGGQGTPKSLLLADRAREAVERYLKPRKKPEPEPEPEPPKSDFYLRMLRAKTANEARQLMHDHEEAIGAFETQLGLEPMCGPRGSGYGWRGFSTLNHAERKKMVKRCAAISAAAGRRMQDLIDDGLALRGPWERLYSREMCKYEPPAAYGGGCVVLVPGELARYEGRYTLRELENVFASHSGVSFAANDLYEYRNDRDYSKTAQAERVVRNAQQFEPSYLLADNPDAVNGPPITDCNGNVLGGNSRLMILERVYAMHPEHAESYKTALSYRVKALGFKFAELEKLKRPVLLRELEDPGDPQQAITRFNKVGTAALTVAERAIVDARRVSAATLTWLAAELAQEGEDATIVKVLSGPRATAIIERLIGDGVIPEQDRAACFDERGLVTAECKQRVSRLAVGRLFETTGDFEAAPAELRLKLERVVASIARVDELAGWGLLDRTKEALSALTEARQRGLYNLDDLLTQANMFASGTYSTAAVRIAKTLQGPTLKAAGAFKQYASDADFSQGGLLGFVEPPTPSEAFAAAFGD